MPVTDLRAAAPSDRPRAAVETAVPPARELTARWLGRMTQTFVVWLVVGLLLTPFVGETVAQIAYVLGFTGLPAFPTLFNVVLLGLLAAGVLRRQRAALIVLGILLPISTLISLGLAVLVPGEPIGGAGTWTRGDVTVMLAYVGVSLAWICLALWLRPAFPARLAPGALWRSCGVLAGGVILAAAAVFTVLAVSAGDRLRTLAAMRWSLDAALGDVPADVSTVGEPGTDTATVSLLAGLISGAALLLAVAVFLRAAPQDPERDIAEELQVRRLLLTYASPREADSLGYFATRDDRRVVFDPTGEAAVSYRLVGGVCLAAGDPLGDHGRWGAAVRAWRAHARRHGWVPAVLGASEDGAAAYTAEGMNAVALGDEAVIEPADFHLDAPGRQAVRRAVAVPRNAGCTVRVRRQSEILDEELAGIVEAADAWRLGGEERGFSMASGRLGDRRDGRSVLVTCHDTSGGPVALLSFVPWGRRGLSLDVMRRSPEAVSGVTELMVTELVAAAASLGVAEISLNFAVFRESFALGERIGASGPARLRRRLLVLASRWWQLQSLYLSNEKYLPQWRRRLVCYDSAFQLSQVTAAVARAEGFLPEPPRLFRRRSRAAELATPPMRARLEEAVGRQEAELLQPAAPVRRLTAQQRHRHGIVEQMRAYGWDPYPAQVPRTTSIRSLLGSDPDADALGGTCSVVGRVMRIRDHGGLCFADLREEGTELQIMVSTDTAEAEPRLWRSWVDRGDLLSVTGELMRTRTGEPTLRVRRWAMAAKCLVPPPDAFLGVVDVEERSRRRHLDLATDASAARRLRARSVAVAALRRTLGAQGYMEVETPILQRVHGGANARPFTTRMNAYDLDLTLRIAPELFLKRLCVAGTERVFEIGRNFRNEGVSFKHNPEFTSLEAYGAFGDYISMRRLTQRLIREAAIAVHGEPVITDPRGGTMPLAEEFPAIRVHDAVARAVGADVDPGTPADRLREICRAHGVDHTPSMTPGALVTALYDDLVEAVTLEPTFYLDFPVETSPLTRTHRQDARLAERWDLVAFGTELGTAYTELTDPLDQRRRLTEQSLQAAAGDPEAMEVDEDFLTALEFGMVPTGGMGLGVDRLVMLLVGGTIRENLAFPFLRPEASV